MDDGFAVWHIDSESGPKRRVRIEVIGKTFALYEQQWRSEAYYFGDLVYRGKNGDSHVFGLEDKIKPRPHWRLGFQNGVPPELSGLLPKMKSPLLTGVGILVIALLGVVIVYLAAAS